MKLKKGETILFIGDSITDCNRGRQEDIYAWAPQHHGTSYVSVVEAELMISYTDLGIKILNRGTADNTIRDLKNRWQKDVMDWQPDWVFVFIGINDVWKQFQYPNVADKWVQPEEYERTYRELIEQTKSAVRKLVLVTPYYLEPNRAEPMRVRMVEYADIVRRLARECDLEIVDLQPAWDELLERMYTQQIAYDRVHPNHVGHVYIAKQIMKLLESE